MAHWLKTGISKLFPSGEKVQQQESAVVDRPGLVVDRAKAAVKEVGREMRLLGHEPSDFKDIYDSWGIMWEQKSHMVAALAALNWDRHDVPSDKMDEVKDELKNVLDEVEHARVRLDRLAESHVETLKERLKVESAKHPDPVAAHVANQIEKFLESRFDFTLSPEHKKELGMVAIRSQSPDAIRRLRGEAAYNVYGEDIEGTIGGMPHALRNAHQLLNTVRDSIMIGGAFLLLDKELTAEPNLGELG